MSRKSHSANVDTTVSGNGVLLCWYARALRRSHRADHVHEDAVALEAHVGQIFREIREVVPQPGFHVLAEVAVDSDERPGSRLAEVQHLEPSALDESPPLPLELPPAARPLHLFPAF